MQIIDVSGSTIFPSSSNHSIEFYEGNSPLFCALRAIQNKHSSNGPSLKDRMITTAPSETIVHFLKEKPKQENPYKNFTDDPYLTFEDLQMFKVETKEEMQSKYVSLLNNLNGSLWDMELTKSLKQIFFLLFYEIDPSVCNDQGETLPALIAKHQNNAKTSDNNKELLSQVYIKYLLVSES
jgi:hypothetical protein